MQSPNSQDKLITKANKQSKFENILLFYGIKKKILIPGLEVHICPFCNYTVASLYINEDFNIAECINCGKRLTPVNFVSELEKMSTVVAALKLNYIMHLKIGQNNMTDVERIKAQKKFINFILIQMAEKRGDVYYISEKRYEEIYKYMLGVGVKVGFIEKFGLACLKNKYFYPIYDMDEEITDILVYDVQTRRVLSLYKKKYDKTYLCIKRKKFEKHID